jgi:hypothetical protein
LQDSVQVHGITIGRLRKNAGVFDGGSYGFWHFEIPDHALGRLLQRDPVADVDQVLWAAHEASLQVHLDHAADQEFLLPAGSGGFVCGTVNGLDENEEVFTFVRVRTCLSEDQLHEEQRFAAVGQELGTRLGDNVLLPIPLRHLAKVSTA